MARFINFMNSLVPTGIVHLLFLFSHFNSPCSNFFTFGLCHFRLCNCHTRLWIAGGITICALSNFINTGQIFGGGGDYLGFFNMKRDQQEKREKGTFTRYVDSF
jgi:hypothetical protein